MSNTLVVLKGLPGAGKTHFLKTKGLDVYSISPDQVRNLIAAPLQVENGEYKINHYFEKQVRKLVIELVENRMQRGELTIIDATHSKLTYWNEYRQLAEKCKAKLYCLDFSHINIETAKKQNVLREEYKQVDDLIIEKINTQLEKWDLPEDIEVIKPDEWDSKFKWKLINLSHYKRIHHFGDIHGCYEPLQEYLKDGLKDDELYIFVGDYVDRGVQNAKVLNYLFSIMNLPNVVFLEGNHEAHLINWANNLQARSKEFERHTKTELEKESVSRKTTRHFCRKLKKAVYYQYDNKEVLVTHGGISRIPDNLLTLSTEQMVRGVGNYSTNIDELFTKNNPSHTYQVHGHRNTFEFPIKAAERSFNLEGGIERGGHLRVVVLDKQGFHPIKVRNATVSARYEKVEEKIFENDTLLEGLKGNRYIKELPQQHYQNISSFNFKEKVFKKGLWDKQTTKARGLFINTESTEIVSRSYNKFFNLNEREETTIEKLKEALVFPVSLYVKENGFLGIMGYDSYYKNIIYSTKNYIQSQHADLFRENFFKRVSLEKEEAIMRALRDENLSLVFEVVDPINDPHIIEYKNSKLVLLDAIFREEEFRKLTYEQLAKLGNELGMEIKEKAFTFNTWEELEEWHEKAEKDFLNQLEGYVIEDRKGFMTKIKLPYYRFWKWMRSEVDKIDKGLEPSKEAMDNSRGKAFLNWYKGLKINKINSDIITLRNGFYNDRI
ncbi:RNA ligase [Priestia megaterium]|uniref:RNA ligase n=1 Tax=Priestia megaterium TaxID=1404 RepID=UPI0035DCD931